VVAALYVSWWGLGSFRRFLREVIAVNESEMLHPVYFRSAGKADEGLQLLCDGKY
jgi:hypothetical protein